LAPHGVKPAHGYYVSISIAVLNTGSQPLTLEPEDFWVEPGRITFISGHATESGAPTQLINTTLGEGQRFRSVLTFDVARPHGVLVFSPNRRIHVLWRF
jgi:hypothetical protein